MQIKLLLNHNLFIYVFMLLIMLSMVITGKEIMDKKKNEHDEEEEKEEVEELEESRTAIFQLPEKDEKFSAPTNDALNLPRNYYYLGLNSDQSHLQSGKYQFIIIFYKYIKNDLN